MTRCEKQTYSCRSLKEYRNATNIYDDITNTTIMSEIA